MYEEIYGKFRTGCRIIAQHVTFLSVCIRFRFHLVYSQPYICIHIQIYPYLYMSIDIYICICMCMCMYMYMIIFPSI